MQKKQQLQNIPKVTMKMMNCGVCAEDKQLTENKTNITFYVCDLYYGTLRHF